MITKVIIEVINQEFAYPVEHQDTNIPVIVETPDNGWMSGYFDGTGYFYSDNGRIYTENDINQWFIIPIKLMRG